MNKSGFLPSRFAINDQLTPLGKLVEKPSTWTEAEIRRECTGYFEAVNHSEVNDSQHGLVSITEADCRQIKGVAQEHVLGAGTDLASAPVATPPSPVDAFCEKHAPPKFKVGSVVKIITSGYEEQVGMVGSIAKLGTAKDEFWVALPGVKAHRFFRSEHLELISDAPPKEGDWITWAGGECPVPANFQVEYRMRGEKTHSRAVGASLLRWRHSDAADPRRENDIVAYRLVKQQ